MSKIIVEGADDPTTITVVDEAPVSVRTTEQRTVVVAQPGAAVDLSAKADKASLFLSVRDYPSVQAALDAAPEGATVYFPPGTYTTASGYVVKQDNTTISAAGAHFIITAWQTPVFDAIGRNGCTFDIGLAEFSGTRGGQGTSFRGSSGYVSGCAVWINGDRNYVRSLRTINLPVAVFLSSWAGSSTYDRIGVGNHIGTVEAEGYNFVLLWTGQEALTVDDLYGHDDIDDSSGTNPTHLYYASSTTSFRSTGVTIKKARCENHLNGQAFQLKYVDQATLTNHTASNCKGLINVIDSHYLTWNGMRGTALLANGGQGAITFQVTTAASKAPNLANTSVQLAAGVNERAVSLIADDAVISGLAIEVNHGSGHNTALNDAILRGNRGRLVGATIRSRGTDHGRGFLLSDLSGAPATAWVIEDPVVEACRGVVDVAGGSVGNTIRLNGPAQSITGGGAAVVVTGTAVGGEYTLDSRVPTGGTTGQALRKKSGTDYDSEWYTPPAASNSTPISAAFAAVSAQAGTSADFSRSDHRHALATVAGLTIVGNPSGTAQVPYGIDAATARTLLSVPSSSDLTTGLSGKANTTHTHAESDVTNLSSDLASRPVMNGVTGAKFYIQSTAPSSPNDGDIWFDTSP